MESILECIFLELIKRCLSERVMLDNAKYHWSDTNNKLLQWVQVEV